MSKNPEVKQLSIFDRDYLNYLIDQVIADPAKFPLIRRRMVGRQWTTVVLTEEERVKEIREYFEAKYNLYAE